MLHLIIGLSLILINQKINSFFNFPNREFEPISALQATYALELSTDRKMLVLETKTV